MAGDLGDGPGGRQVPVQHDEVAVLLDGVGQGADDALAVGVRFDVREVLGEGLAGHRETAAVQEARVQQDLHERADPADLDQFGHRVAAGGTHVGEHRNALAYPREVVEFECNAGGVRDREQVQDGVGGPFERDADGDRVLERLARQDVGRPDAALDQPRDGGAGAVTVLALVVADRVLGGRVRQRQPERLDGRGHGVGGVHAAAGAGPGNGGLLHLEQFHVADLPGCMGADGLEHGDDVTAFGAGQDRAAVDEHARAVQPGHRHRTRRHVLVAATDGDETVEALRADDRLDRVRDHFPGDQRVAHTGRAHRYAVGDGDGVEDDALRPGLVRTHAGGLRQGVDVHVAGRHHAPGGGDADLGLAEILGFESDRAQHGAARRLCHAVDDDG